MGLTPAYFAADLPVLGDLAWLHPRNCRDVAAPAWFRVLAARVLYEPAMHGWGLLDGWFLTRDGHGPERTVTVARGRVGVRRDAEATDVVAG